MNFEVVSRMNRPDPQNYYEVLGLTPAASDAQIREAYRAVASNPPLDAALRARQLEAMEMLTEPDLRVEYDRSLKLEAGAQGEGTAGARADGPTQLSMGEVVADADRSGSRRFARPEFLPPGTFAGAPSARLRERDEGSETSLRNFSETTAAVAVAGASPVSSAKAEKAGLRRPHLVPALAFDRASASSGADRPKRQLAVAAEMAQEAAIGIAESGMARASARANEVRSTEVKSPPFHIHPDAEFSGDLLRQVRKSRGLSVAQVSDHTRISQRHLENIEADQFDALPPTVYLRGMLHQLARELGLNGARVATRYLGRIPGKGK